MRIAILGFVAGAGWLQVQSAIPSLRWLALVTMLALLMTWLASRRPLASRSPSWRMLQILLLVTISLALGICWAAQRAQWMLAPSLAARDEGRDITLVGTIDNLPYVFGQGVRFNFAVERVLTTVGRDAIRVPPRVALSWYRPLRPVSKPGASAATGATGATGTTGVTGTTDDNGQLANIDAVGNVQPGERWQLTVRLQRPHGNVNPYGFDYEAWLLEQGLRATGYVRPAASNGRLDSFVLSFGNIVEHCRAVLRARILRTLPGKEYAGVIVALVVGDQRGIDQSDWQVFNRTGVGHLISISGLHITMVAGMAALAASSLWRRSLFTRWQLPLLLPAQKVAALAGAAVALLYVLLAGFGVPAQRTLYMLTVIACALWSGRIARVSHVLCWALGTVVLLDPWAVLWPGFWLSFGAVAMILYASVGRTVARPVPTPTPVPAPMSRRQLWWLALKLGAHTQYVVTLGLVPLTMLLFAQVSLVSPLANAVAIPLISLVVTPLSLAGSLLPAPLAWPLLSLAHLLVQALAACLRWFSSWPAAVWSAPMPPWWQFGWAMVGTCWMLAPRGWPQRWLGLLTWLPLLTAQPARPAQGQMQLIVFDVGQGMAVLVQTARHVLLYDTGPAYGPGTDAGNRVILPYLKARGIAALDGMVVSHSDADHAGGALTLLQGLSVGWLLSSLPAAHPVAKAAPLFRHCAAGQHWDWDGVHIEVLHPLPGSYADPARKPNSRSCVLKLSTATRSVLLAGDIEAGDEAALVARAAPLLPADVLLVPHHGSGTSSTPAFLVAVHPSLALFQLGYRNRYHHPKPEVYQRYGKLGITRLRTDETGALVLDIGEQVALSAWRIDHGRYWNGR